MKSQRGQIQESNFLADKIEQQIVRIRPFLPALAGLILIGVLGLIGYGIYSTQRESRAARAWTDFYFADTRIEVLDGISKDYNDTSAGLWAVMTAGDRGMAQAMEKWNIDRTIAEQRFQEAADDYRDVVARTNDSFLKSRALYGLAQALEGLGKRTDAVDHYRQIVSLTGLPSEYVTEVNARIKWLEGKEGEAFYTWYNEERRNAPAPTSSSPIPGLPNLPNIQFPPIRPNPVPDSQPAADSPATSDSAPPTQPDPTKSEDKP